MPLSPQQLGVCSWSIHPDSPQALRDQMRALGLSKVQLVLRPVTTQPDLWGQTKQVLDDAGITIVSGMFGTVGEDYSTLASIRQTGGVVPDEHWPANWEIARRSAAIAAEWDVPLVSFHAGFLPADAADPNRNKLLERIGKITEHFAGLGLTLLLETGQERAATLSSFLDALEQQGRRNVMINFDPANMILYNMGDPVESLRLLLPRVRQVHLKDALHSPTPGQWGKEAPVGDGDVDWRAFVRVLTQANFTGDLVVEREAGKTRIADIRKAVEHLSALFSD
ncbi:MAG: TIM barrel protein [Phycisphaeraceae bacterium]